MRSRRVAERRPTGQKKRFRYYGYINSYHAERIGANRIDYQQRHPATDPSSATSPFPEPEQW